MSNEPLKHVWIERKHSNRPTWCKHCNVYKTQRNAHMPCPVLNRSKQGDEQQ